MPERLKPSLSKTVRLEDGAGLPDPSPDDSGVELPVDDDLGKTVASRYRLRTLLGQGGMGVVYRAEDVELGRPVAIKVVRAEYARSERFLSRFRRELEVTSQLRHPSTVRVFGHGELDDGRPYMVMELLTGESLADRLERGQLSEIEALQYARQIAESLSEAHEHDIFHRDLKPENIFIETVGMSTVVKVLDFGIAGGIDARRLTQAGEVFGTPQYMSPEQCNGLPLDHRTDIYSLGCILFECIEGQPPFSAESPMATMLKHVKNRVPRMVRATSTTAKIVQTALRKDRARRIQSAAEFAEAIGQCIGSLRGGEPSQPGVAVPRHRPVAMLGDTDPAGIVLSPPGGLHELLERHGRTVAIALLVLALGTTGWLLFTPRNVVLDPASAAADGRVPAAPPPTTPAVAGAPSGLPNARALVRTNVDRATVQVDGLEQCATPCSIKVPVGDGRPHEIRLVKHGYIDVVTNWQPQSVSEPLPTLPDMKKL